MNTAPASPGKDVVVNIEPGSTLADVAALLERQGAVSDAFRFQMLARAKGQGGKLPGRTVFGQYGLVAAKNAGLAGQRPGHAVPCDRARGPALVGSGASPGTGGLVHGPRISTP